MLSYGGLLKKVHLWYSLRDGTGEHEEFLNQNRLGIIRLVVVFFYNIPESFLSNKITCKNNYLLFYFYHNSTDFTNKH